MLKQRIITAAVLTPLILALIFLTSTPVFAALLALIFLLGIWEWTRMAGVRRRPLRVLLLVGYAILFALCWPLLQTRWWWTPVLAGLVWWLFALSWLTHIEFAIKHNLNSLIVKLFSGVLMVVPAWCAVVVLHGGRLTPDSPRGCWWVLGFALIVFAADIGAYFAGTRWGRNKLAPRVSPGKTREGVYGALVSSGIVGLICGAALHVPAIRLPAMVALALVTVLFSIVGDLFESLIKRHAGVKDSGSLFPGHGGVFDRMDSIIAALPVFVLGKVVLGL